MSKIGSIEITGEFFRPVITDATYEELNNLKNINVNTEAPNAIIFSVPHNEEGNDIPNNGSIWLTDSAGYLYCISTPVNLTLNEINAKSNKTEFDDLTNLVDNLNKNQDTFITYNNLLSFNYVSEAKANDIANIISIEKIRELIDGAPSQYDTLKKLSDGFFTLENKVNYISTLLLSKVNEDDIYSIDEINSKLNLLDVYTRSEIDYKLSYIENLIRNINNGEQSDIPINPSTNTDVKQYYWYIGQSYPNSSATIAFENNQGWRYIGTSTDGYEYSATGNKAINSSDNNWAVWYLALPKDSNLSIFTSDDNIDFIDGFENIGSLLYNNVAYNVIKIYESYKFSGWIIKNKTNASPTINYYWYVGQEYPSQSLTWKLIGKSTSNYIYKAINDNILSSNNYNYWYVALPSESNLSIFNINMNIDFYDAFEVIDHIKYNYIKYDIIKMFKSYEFKNWEIKNRTKAAPSIDLYWYVGQAYPETDSEVISDDDPNYSILSGWRKISDIYNFAYDTTSSPINRTMSSGTRLSPWYVAIPQDSDIWVFNTIGENQLYNIQITNDIIKYKNVNYNIFKFTSNHVSTTMYDSYFKGWLISNNEHINNIDNGNQNNQQEHEEEQTLQPESDLYFYVGTEKPTSLSQAQTVTSYPAEQTYTNNSGAKSQIYVLTNSNKTVTIHEPNTGAVLNIETDTTSISGYNITYTTGKTANTGSVKIKIS